MQFLNLAYDMISSSLFVLVSMLVKSATMDVFEEYFPEDRDEEEMEDEGGEAQLSYDVPPYQATSLAAIKDPSRCRR
jgi:hypothetical protein